MMPTETDALREALYRAIGSRVTDARVHELMVHAAVPLHGHPMQNSGGYVAALLRADLKDEIDKVLAHLEQEEPTRAD